MLITRNFDASKIAQDQVLDRKSEKALFTEVADGSRPKTLNLILKESAKNGYFGKTELSGNSDGYYNSSAILAAFKGKEQFTALSLATNIGTLGLTNITGGSGGVKFTGKIIDQLDASARPGIPQFEGIALHYANTHTGPANHVAANSQFGHYSTQPWSTSQTFQAQPRYTIMQNQKSASSNQ